MRLRKSECEAEPQHKSHAICQSHQQPCWWDLIVKVPAQSLSALSHPADNVFSSKTLPHETKKIKYLTTEVNSGFQILLFLIGDEHVIKGEKKKTAVKWLRTRYFWVTLEAFSATGLHTPDLQHFQDYMPKIFPYLTSRFETSTK